MPAVNVGPVQRSLCLNPLAVLRILLFPVRTGLFIIFAIVLYWLSSAREIGYRTWETAISTRSVGRDSNLVLLSIPSFSHISDFGLVMLHRVWPKASGLERSPLAESGGKANKSARFQKRAAGIDSRKTPLSSQR